MTYPFNLKRNPSTQFIVFVNIVPVKVNRTFTNRLSVRPVGDLVFMPIQLARPIVLDQGVHIDQLLVWIFGFHDMFPDKFQVFQAYHDIVAKPGMFRGKNSFFGSFEVRVYLQLVFPGLRQDTIGNSIVASLNEGIDVPRD
jgi:hypothetical protein